MTNRSGRHTNAQNVTTLNPTSIAIPKYLFRYLRDDDHLLETLTTPYLWFSDPKSFNDPFDLTNVLEFDASVDEFMWYMRKYGHLDPDHESEIQRLVESGDPRVAEVMTTILTALHTVYLQRIGVCCCSFRSDSPLMWAHYSGGHSGVCLVLNAASFVTNYSLIEVQYRAEVPKWSVIKKRFSYGESLKYNRDFDQVVLGTKYSDWAYEEEYRLISPTRGKNILDPECVAGVILGARMAQSRKDEIKASVTSSLPHAVIVDEELHLTTGSVSVPFFDNEKGLGGLSAWRLLTDTEGQLRPPQPGPYSPEDHLRELTVLSGLPYPTDKFEVGSRPTIRIYKGGNLKNPGPKVAEVKGLITDKGLDLPSNTLLFSVNPATGHYLHTPHVSLYMVGPDGKEIYGFSFEIAAGPPNPLIGY